MKLNAVAKTMAASAVALLIAGCGGGGGGGASVGDAASLEIKGTAAVGAALSGAAVAVKCATGSGTGSTTATGSYTVSMPGAALPCIIQVSGEVGGVAVTLHSVAEAGTASGANTTAVANVTPVTEMIVAQLLASLPADAFSSFDAQKVTTAAITTAVTAIVDALKTAGVDLGSIDPLKATLVPASGNTAGNDYDKLLDALGEKVPSESLSLVVNQIANAAGSNSSEGLGDAMVAVSGGTLEGCAQAVSGKYRTLDFFGRTFVRQIDFSTKKFSSGDGQTVFDITADAAKPCEFTVTGTSNGEEVRFDVVIGPSGAGGYRSQNLVTGRSIIGYIFPVQAHALSAVAGEWDFLQSGFMPGDGLVQWPGKLNFAADNKVNVCDYDTSTWTCASDDGEDNLSITARTDGGFDLNESSLPGVANLWGYRAPNGSLAVFGTTNAAGANLPDTEQSIIVGTKLSKLALPAEGSVSKFWDMGLSQPGNQSTRVVTSPVKESVTVKTVDTATGAVTRKRESDGREDVVRYNNPIDGVRLRDAGTWNSVPFASVYQMPITGLGITMSVNANPHPSGNYIYNISVTRP
jgi:hypothetical protein